MSNMFSHFICEVPVHHPDGRQQETIELVFKDGDSEHSVHVCKTGHTYTVEVSRNQQSYKAKYRTDSPYVAMRWYGSLLVHSGYNKRLVCDGQVLSRVRTGSHT